MLNPARILPHHAEQGILFAEHFIGDRLPANHPVFAFKELIQKLDLRILEKDYSKEGGHMFAPRDLLAVMSYGYTKGICSSYQLADAVAHRLDFLFLAGGHAIKRRTLSDFRARHRAAMAQIFLQTVELADKVGLIDRTKIFALDGTKIHASANKDQRKERIEKIDKALQQTDAETINLTDPDSREMKKGTGTDDAYVPLRHAMREKVKSPEGRAIYRQRGGEIEPRFGWKKRITLPQFRLRGLLGASAEAGTHGGGDVPARLSSCLGSLLVIVENKKVYPDDAT